MESQYGQTMIHPVALAITLAMSIAICLVRRDRAAVPLLVVACFVTHAQRIVVGGLDFSLLRIVVIFGWARILMRGETSLYRFHPLDRYLVLWQLMATLAYIVGPRGSFESFVYRLGTSFDAAGIYFLFRILLRDASDVRRAIESFGWMSVLLVGPMIIENLTGRNAFSILGGVSEITWIRDGRMRCQASFSHPIMAGSFGASTLAMIWGLWLGYPRQRVFLTAAAVASVGIVILSASSGPLMAFLSALLGWILWRLRAHMRLMRWGTMIFLIVVHFAREKPVWHLIGRVSSITGGTGWHRYILIDEFLRRFNEWWLIGARTTAHWNIPNTPLDITNQYVLEGVRGGLGNLAAFVAILVVGFRAVGEVRERVAADRGAPARERRRTELLAWSLGVCLFAHSVAFIGVSYFGQVLSLFYLHLAMVASLAIALRRRPAPRGACAATEPQRRAASAPLIEASVHARRRPSAVFRREEPGGLFANAPDRGRNHR